VYNRKKVTGDKLEDEKKNKILKIVEEIIDEIEEDTGYGNIFVILKGEQPAFVEKSIKHKI